MQEQTLSQLLVAALGTQAEARAKHVHDYDVWLWRQRPTAAVAASSVSAGPPPEPLIAAAVAASSFQTPPPCGQVPTRPERQHYFDLQIPRACRVKRLVSKFRAFMDPTSIAQLLFTLLGLAGA